MSCLPRAPGPIIPTRIRSLAPNTRELASAVPATAAAPSIKLLRENIDDSSRNPYLYQNTEHSHTGRNPSLTWKRPFNAETPRNHLLKLSVRQLRIAPSQLHFFL